MGSSRQWWEGNEEVKNRFRKGLQDISAQVYCNLVGGGNQARHSVGAASSEAEGALQGTFKDWGIHSA